jgi:hypothetical protein
MTRTYSASPQYRFALAVAFASVCVILPSVTHAASMPISGWAWSAGTDAVTGQSFPYMGWISMSGSSYGVQEDTETGALSGYAWSPYFGYISFQAGDAAHPNPRVNKETGRVTGWIRSCAAFANKSGCGGALDPNAGGWDGWISLEGSNYSMTQDDNCEWSGYAWGAASVAGISVVGPGYQVSGVTGDPACKRTGIKPNLKASTVTVPANVQPGVAVNLSSTISNNGTVTTGKDFPVLFQIHPATIPATIAETSVKKNLASATLDAGASIAKTAVHTFPTKGKWFVRACADMSTVVPSVVDELNEDDNCGDEWKEVNVGEDEEEDDEDSCTPGAQCYTTAKNTCGMPGTGTCRADGTCNATVPSDSVCSVGGGEGEPVVSIDATPLRVPKDGNTKVMWEATNVRRCRIEGPTFSNGWIQGPTLDDEKSVPITEQSVFRITCESLDGSADVSEKVIVNILPDFNEF